MSKRILVVEDQPDNRQIIRDMLAGTDYEITEAEDGEQALAAIAKQRPDLILMDIQLPIIDGYEATRRIKADPARLPLSTPSRSTYTSRPVKEGSAARTRWPRALAQSKMDSMRPLSRLPVSGRVSHSGPAW